MVEKYFDSVPGLLSKYSTCSLRFNGISETFSTHIFLKCHQWGLDAWKFKLWPFSSGTQLKTYRFFSLIRESWTCVQNKWLWSVITSKSRLKKADSKSKSLNFNCIPTDYWGLQLSNCSLAKLFIIHPIKSWDLSPSLKLFLQLL